MNFWLRISAVLTLLALALMVWSLFQPTPMPVMIAMTVGQAFGTAAFGAFGYVVFKDITRQRAERRSERNARLSQELEVIRESSRKIKLDAVARESAQQIEAKAADAKAEPAARESSPQLEPSPKVEPTGGDAS